MTGYAKRPQGSLELVAQRLGPVFSSHEFTEAQRAVGVKRRDSALASLVKSGRVARLAAGMYRFTGAA